MVICCRRRINTTISVSVCVCVCVIRGSVVLVAVHGHSLRAAAHLAVSSRADGSAAVALGAGVLEGQELLGAEGLVVNLRCRLDEVLEVGTEEEISEVDKLAVGLVLNVDHSPPVLAAADLLVVDDD